MILPKDFVITQNVHRATLLKITEKLLRNQLLHVVDCGTRGTANVFLVERLQLVSLGLELYADPVIQDGINRLTLVLGHLNVLALHHEIVTLIVGDAFQLAEDLLLDHFPSVKFRHHLEDDVLHFAVESDAVQRVGPVDDHIAFGASVAFLRVQSLHDAALAESVEAFGDRRSVDQVAFADVARYVRVQRLNRDSGVHGYYNKPDSSLGVKN